jgi:hypothetical protein
MSKVIAESEHWILNREYLEYEQKYFSIRNKETREYMIITEEELKELLSFNSIPLESA